VLRRIERLVVVQQRFGCSFVELLLRHFCYHPTVHHAYSRLRFVFFVRSFTDDTLKRDTHAEDARFHEGGFPAPALRFEVGARVDEQRRAALMPLHAGLLERSERRVRMGQFFSGLGIGVTYTSMSAVKPASLRASLNAFTSSSATITDSCPKIACRGDEIGGRDDSS
jgi:hypothetical protein